MKIVNIQYRFFKKGKLIGKRQRVVTDNVEQCIKEFEAQGMQDVKQININGDFSLTK